MNKLKIYLIIALALICNVSFAQNTPKNNIKLSGIAELGFVGVLGNKIQFSQNGTYINYLEDGAQDNLFPVCRLALEVSVNNKHYYTFLYQPLRLESTALLYRALVIDELTFPAGTGVNFLYNFPFFRFSYMKELMPNNDKWDFAFGASLQLRNATISFESTDGTLFRSRRDVGPVPILKMRTRYNKNDRTYTEFEADGFYAPISYLNGSDNEVIGAILDASIRQGLKITNEVDAFLNLRYLGGGAVGESDLDFNPGDGYTKNWLHFTTVTIGFKYQFSGI
ncbi:MAG: hypothetical protein ACPGLV_03005 [Bacteroidia bacterium]